MSSFLAGSFVCRSFLCWCVHIQGSTEEKMGTALIKAKARVSSAVISRPGATANQWTASTAIIINGSRSEKLEGNKKEWERLYQEAPTTCAEQEKAGEMETNRPREQDWQWAPNAVCSRQFCHHHKGNFLCLLLKTMVTMCSIFIEHCIFSQVIQRCN